MPPRPLAETDIQAARSRRFAWRRVLQIGVTAGSIAALLALTDLRAVGRLVASASLPLLLLAAAFAVGDRVLMVGKWLPLLRVQSSDVPRGAAVRTYLAAGFAIYLLPFAVGADVLRALALGRRRDLVPQVAASVAAERILGIVASGLMAAVALAVALAQGVELTFLLPWSLVAIAAGLTVLVVPLSRGLAARAASLAERVRLGRPGSFMRRLGSAYASYRGHPRLLASVGALSVLEQLFPVVTNWLLARALDLPVEFAALLVVMPLTLFLARLPISVGGVGVAEGSIVYLLGLFGIPPEQALALAVLARALDIVVLGLPGAFLWRHLVGGEERSPRGP